MLSVLGIVLGTRLTRYVSQVDLKRAFAVLLVLMGAFILYRNHEELLAPRTEPSLLDPSPLHSETS